MNDMEVIIKNSETKEEKNKKDMDYNSLNYYQNNNNNNNPNENNINTKLDLKKNENDNYNNNNGNYNDNNSNEQNLELSSNKEINLETSKFPYCIVWTPIPILTYLIPSLGHSGIGDSNGMIHDFAGSFYIGVDNFAFGKPTKYFRLELSNEEKKNLDKAIELGDQKFSKEEHHLITNNCHSHVAYILNQLNYLGKNDYNMFSIWWMLIIKGKFVSCCGFFKTYIGFLIIILIIALIVIIVVVVKK